MIGFDTNVLIYASVPVTVPDPYGLHQSARELVNQFSSDKLQMDKRVLLPSICLAKFLTGIEKLKRGAVLKNLEKWTFIAGFDARAASVTADLIYDALQDWKQEKNNNPQSDYAQRTRQIIKSDVIVLATAIAHGGTVLYTKDEAVFTRLSGGQITIKSLPALQPTLFSSLEFNSSN